MKNFKIVKRSLAVFVSMAMACSMAGVSAAAEGIHATSSIASYTAQQDGFLIENDVLISYTGNDEHVVIPDGVTKIGEGAFNKNKTLVSVHIPDSVTVIGEYAFNSCDKLKNVDIPSHLESVGMSAFSNTIWGKNHPTFISGTTLFGTGYAIGCVVIPDGVTKIGDNAFSECMYLSSVHIPDTVTAIGENAFESCIQLFTISIPKSVSSIGKGAFSGCCNLSRITIPEGITRIEDFTFHGCTYLETVNIPNTVTSIGEWAFRSCRNLTSIEFPNSITNIENPEHQFDGCDKLTTIYGTAGSYAETFAKKYGYQFISNTSTQKFDIQDGTLVKYTGTAKNVVIPDGVTKIGAHAFENCTQVRTVHIPDGVTAIEDYAFSGCNNLTTINIPNSVIKLGEFAFYLCFDLNNLSIPESVTDIGMYTFTYCESLTDIIIPSQITMLKEGVFAFCRNLVNVNLPEIVEQIDNGAFRYCTSLTDITIPKQVTVIHQDAFDECRNLQTIYGYGGSCAELFAGSIGYLFVDLNQPFTDVISREWFYDAVVFAYQRGIMTGMDETTFGPSVSMARDHIVTMLYRLEGEPEVTYEPVFPDVLENDFYTDAVMWGNQVGIATGYENGNFGIGDEITREQVVTMLYRYAQYKGLDTSQETSLEEYKDGTDVSDFAKDAMEWALAAGIIKGENNEGVINPQGSADRAGGATIMMRFMEHYQL